MKLIKKNYLGALDDYRNARNVFHYQGDIREYLTYYYFGDVKFHIGDFTGAISEYSNFIDFL